MTTARKRGARQEVTADADLRSLIERVTGPARDILDPLCGLTNGNSEASEAVKGVLAAARSADIQDERERALVLADANSMEDRWAHFARQAPQSEQTVSRFLSELALASRSPLEGPGVRVLTVHAAKGLEFRAVIIVGMNEDTFPDYRSVNSADAVAEERRNAYVAVTRAERMLQLTRPRTRVMPWGDSKPQRPSRFLAEMGVTSHDE